MLLTLTLTLPVGSLPLAASGMATFSPLAGDTPRYTEPRLFEFLFFVEGDLSRAVSGQSPFLGFFFFFLRQHLEKLTVVDQLTELGGKKSRKMWVDAPASCSRPSPAASLNRCWSIRLKQLCPLYC